MAKTTRKTIDKGAEQPLSAAFTCGACVYCYNRPKGAENALCSRDNRAVKASDEACPSGERRKGA